MLNPKQQDFLAAAARAAMRSERSYGVPAALTLAQAVLESGWGSKMPGNNCFGIKRAARHEQGQTFATHEAENGKLKACKAEFAAFDSLEACFEDHAILISQRRPYDSFFRKYEQDENLTRLIGEVARVYATDPAYAKKVCAVMSMEPFRRALAKAKADSLLT
jgi:flagellar protein FlgJ